MSLEIIIAIAVIGMLVFVIGLKIWLGKLFDFKMNEGEILCHMQDNPGNAGFHTLEAIAEGTKLKLERVTEICHQSTQIAKHAERDLWRLK